MTRLLVTGDRHWGEGKHRAEDYALLNETLDDMDRLYGITLVIEGCARGADRMAGWPCPLTIRHSSLNAADVPDGWAARMAIQVEHHPAHWEEHSLGCFCPPGKSYCGYAGHRRNEEMLRDGKPELVVAFHRSLRTSKGTAHMVRIAREAGIPAFVFPH